MIIDNIDNYGRYLGLNKNIDAALKFIAEDLKKAIPEDGTYSIVKDEVTAHIVSRNTHERSDAKMEIHKNNMDIHYIIEGGESCEIAGLPEESRIDYNPETDNGFWDCEDDYKITVKQGEFYAVWPMEPHCPLCNTSHESKNIRKVIIKVKLD